MDYELAKELKDAGFPQMWGLTPEEQKVVEELGERSVYPNAYIPTLEELIEACQPSHSFVLRHDECWEAFDRSVDGSLYRGGGISPEEAVARLWLALNAKAV
jgi:hypothetical protein